MKAYRGLMAGLIGLACLMGVVGILMSKPTPVVHFAPSDSGMNCEYGRDCLQEGEPGPLSI